MTTTTTYIPDTVGGLVGATDRPPFPRSSVLGGLGGLCFVAIVIAQNAIRANFPANDATAAHVMDYYGSHRHVTVALAALFPIGFVGLAAFIGTLLARAGRGAGRAAAIVASFGAAGLIGTYTMLMASDIAIAGYIHRGAADLGVVDALWVFHNAVFGLLLASIGVTLAGLTTASSAAGVLAARWKTAGLVGAALLLVAAATTPAIVEASPTMVIGLLGFVVWIVFVVRTSALMLRRRHG